MAVYTFVTKDQLREAAAPFVGETGELVSLSPVTAGVTNSNYKAEFTNGRWILTIFELTQDYPHLPFFMEVIAAAARAGLPAPAPLHGKTFELAGKPAVLCPFFPGSPPPSPPPPFMTAQAGTALGKFHAAAASVKSAKENTWSFGTCAAFFAEAQPDITRRYPTAAEALAREFDELSEPLRVSKARRGVVHGDLFPDNTLFAEGKLSATLDWYYACEEPLLYDVAVCLNAWCFERRELEFNYTGAARFLQAYLAESPPEAAEECAELPVFLRFAAVRFLCSRLQAALYPPPEAVGTQHDPEAYLRRILFHRSAPSHGIYAEAASAAGRAF